MPSNFPMGIPASRSNLFITSLSIPTAEPRTPAPTNGTSANLRSPCTVPSSPKGPCRTGKTTSIFPSTVPESRVRMPSPEGAIESDRLDQAGSPTDMIKTITLKVLVQNPSETAKALLPVDYYLPREVKEKDVLDPGEFEVRFDVTRNEVFLHKA